MIRPTSIIFTKMITSDTTLAGAGHFDQLEYLYNACPGSLLVIILATVIMAICTIPCYVFDRWFPKLIGK